MQLSPARPLRTFSFSASPALGAQIFDKCCCCQDQYDDCQQPEKPHAPHHSRRHAVHHHASSPFWWTEIQSAAEVRCSSATLCATAPPTPIALMYRLPGLPAP